MRRSPTALIIVVLGLTAACRAERLPPNGSRATVQQGAPSPVATDSTFTRSAALERPMSQRREAQGLLDSARAQLVLLDTAGASRLLTRAGAFVLVQASSPTTAGTGDLLAASAALDSLAGRLAPYRAANLVRLDRLSARVNLGEARRHATLAAVAWSTHSRESVCDELTMAADHVQRAAADARLTLPARTQRVLDDIHTIVVTLSTQPETDIHEIDEPLARLQEEIGALQRRVAAAGR